MEAFKYNNQYDYSLHPDIAIGEMKFKCKYCKALKFKKEAKGICCCNGKIILMPLKDPPKPLMDLVTKNTEISTHFLRNIRKYNAAFQMTSFGASKILNNEEYLPTFKIQGINILKN